MTQCNFTKFPNDLLERLMEDTELSAGDRRCLDLIIRKTIGFHKEKDRISLTQFEKHTKLSRQGVVNSIKVLLRNNYAIVEETPKGNEYELLWGSKVQLTSKPDLTSKVELTSTSKVELTSTSKVELTHKRKDLNKIKKESVGIDQGDDTDSFQEQEKVDVITSPLKTNTRDSDDIVTGELYEGYEGELDEGEQQNVGKAKEYMTVEKFVNYYYKFVLGEDTGKSFKARHRDIGKKSVARYVSQFGEEEVYNMCQKAKDDGYRYNLDDFVGGGHKNYVEKLTSNNLGIVGELIKVEVCDDIGIKKHFFKVKEKDGSEVISQVNTFI